MRFSRWLFPVLVVFLVVNCQAQISPSVSVIHRFPLVNGQYPQGWDPLQPIQGAGGNLIGVTRVGGTVGPRLRPRLWNGLLAE